MINLKFLKMLLMITHSVLLMMINQICLTRKYKNLYKWMTIIIILHDQNLILKFLIENHDRQNFNHSKKFRKYLIFPTLTLFTTVRHHSLTNQVPLCIPTNHKPPTGTLEPKLIYNHYRDQIVVFSSHQLPFRVNILFHYS